MTVRVWPFRPTDDDRFDFQRTAALTAYMRGKIRRPYTKRSAILSVTCCMKRYLWWSKAKPGRVLLRRSAGPCPDADRANCAEQSDFITPASLLAKLVDDAIYQEPEQIK